MSWQVHISNRTGDQYVTNTNFGLSMWTHRKILRNHLERVINPVQLNGPIYNSSLRRILFPDESDFSNWVIFWSENRNQPYLWHHITGEKIWI